MRRILLSSFASIFLFAAAFGQVYHYKISVIGSSTAFGTGATPIDSSWVNLIQDYLRGQHEIDTIYNRAVGGTFTGDGASGKASEGIDWVLANDNPDVVIVSYASNDAAGDVPLDTTMAHLRYIYNAVTKAGKIAWITTPHPRDGLSASSDSLQTWNRDSTFMEFGSSSLDFWAPLVASDGVSIATQYNFDGVHVNNAGHQVLYQVVKNANIMAPLIVPLPLVLDSLTAVPQKQDILLSWHASDNTGPMHFVIQRSADGETYKTIGEEDAGTNPTGARFTYQDATPLAGRDYYRLQTTADGKVTYSPVVSLNWNGPDWAIGEIYLPQGGSQLKVALQSSKSRNVTLTIFDAMGRQVSSQTGYVAAPGNMLTVPVSGLAQGQYFLRIISADGETGTKTFLKW